MNIRAVMAALDVWDLDRNAKHALVVLGCRADRHTALAEVSLGRVAADMKVGYYAASHALDRAVESGYLIVDKSPGKVPMWMLTSAVNLRDPGKTSAVNLRDPGKTSAVPPRSEQQPPRSDRGLRSLKEKETDSAAASLADPASGDAVEEPPAFADHARRLRLIREGQL